MHSKERDKLKQRFETEPKLFCYVELRDQVYLRNEVDGRRKLIEDEYICVHMYTMCATMHNCFVGVSNGLPLALSLLPKVHFDTFYSSHETFLFSHAGVNSTSTQRC